MFTLATIAPKTAEVIPTKDLAAEARAGLREFKSKEKEKISAPVAKAKPPVKIPRGDDGPPSAEGVKYLAQRKGASWATAYVKRAGLEKIADVSGRILGHGLGAFAGPIPSLAGGLGADQGMQAEMADLSPAEQAILSKEMGFGSGMVGGLSSLAGGVGGGLAGALPGIAMKRPMLAGLGALGGAVGGSYLGGNMAGHAMTRREIENQGF